MINWDNAGCELFENVLYYMQLKFIGGILIFVSLIVGIIPIYPCYSSNFNPDESVVTPESSVISIYQIDTIVLKQLLGKSEHYYNKGQFDSSLISVDSILLQTATDIGQKYFASALLTKAKIKWRYGDNLVATELIQDAIRIFELLRDNINLVKAKTMLADIYVSMSNLDEAAYLYKDVLEIAKSLNDSAGIASAYEHLGVVDYFKENYASSIDKYKKSLEINSKRNDEMAAALNIANIGEAYLRLGQYEKAIKNLMQSKNTLEKHDFNSGLIFVHYTLGQALNKQGKFHVATDQYRKSLKLIEETGERREENEVIRLMAENYAAQNNYRKAYDLIHSYAIRKDSVELAENDLRIEELQIKYQIEQRDKKNAQLKLANQEAQIKLDANATLIKTQYIAGAIIIILLFILAVILILLVRNRNQLSEANETKDKLFSIIGHDLNGTVQNMASLTKLLESERDFSGSEIFPELKKTSNKLSTLVRDLLSWSLSQTKRLQFDPGPVSLNNIIDDSLELLEYTIKAKSLIIKKSLSENLLVHADRIALSTILRNILSNAIKFSPQKAMVVINCELIEKDNRSHVKISVSDEGKGFSEDLIKQITHGDHWKSSLGTFNEKGSGYGFTLIKEFVKKSNSELTIENNKNGGATISFTLLRL